MKVSHRISRHGSDLQYLARAKTALRNRAISQASKDLIQAVVDVARALIKGEVSMTSRQLNTVRRHESNFRKLVKPGSSLSERKRTLQIGGFLPAILGPLLKVGLPLVSGLLGIGSPR